MNLRQRGDTVSSRLGVTLIEVVVAISIAGLIATVTVRLFHAMLRQQAVAAEQLSSSIAITHLRDRFTKDVNAATTATLADRQLQLTLPGDTSIRWEAKNVFAVRKQDDNTDARSEYFDIPTGYSVDFTREPVLNGNAEQHSLITLLLSPNGIQRDPRYITTRRTRRCTAELSRDHRWSGAGEHRAGPHVEAAP